MDEKNTPFINPGEIRDILRREDNPSVEQVRRVVERSLALNRLSLEETAVLLGARGEESTSIIMEGARTLKRAVYGERIVLFAPLYIGNRCTNNCSYCGFRRDNALAVRHTLSDAELRAEVAALERTGQKRLILVYGEHPAYSAEYIAHTVREVYATRGEASDRINRVNINAAPFDTEGFRIVHDAGIGTYQIFQESYDREVYARFHPSGRKADYDWRLTAMDRAMEAGIDDVGLGVLFGLGDWRFEVMGLVRHTIHLEECFGVGPHTISFPRTRRASGVDPALLSPVGDDDFALAVAVLRLAVPYAGLILTARETQDLRNRLIDYGISQIDAGTRLEIGGYAASRAAGQDINREQFEQSDGRTLAQAAEEMIEAGMIPSFCTACYRLGRTGEHFMAFSTKGFIKRFCTPNALLSLAEYIEDYAPEQLREKGWKLINGKLSEDPELEAALRADLEEIRRGRREIIY